MEPFGVGLSLSVFSRHCSICSGVSCVGHVDLRRAVKRKCGRRPSMPIGKHPVNMRFAVFIYDGVEPVDLATYGVLSMARRIAPEISMFTVAPRAGEVRWQMACA